MHVYKHGVYVQQQAGTIPASSELNTVHLGVQTSTTIFSVL